MCKFTIVLVWHQFSPIPILLFKPSKKYEGVQKFIKEKPSYKFVYGGSCSINDFFETLISFKLFGKYEGVQKFVLENPS
jgi:hypothetical protein